MPYKKSDNLTFTRVKVPANHLEWLAAELGAPSHADLLAGLVHFATTPAGMRLVRASKLVPQRKVPTPPADAVAVTNYVAEGGVYIDPRAVGLRKPAAPPVDAYVPPEGGVYVDPRAVKRVELTKEELDALLRDI